MDSLGIPSRVLEGDFAGWLREAMAARRLSTRMLAIRAGIDHSTIYRLATGDRQPSLATAVALLRVLAADPSRPTARAPRHGETVNEPEQAR